MLSPDAVARGNHVSVYDMLPHGPAPYQDLRLLVGQPGTVFSVEADDVRQESSV